MSAQLKRLPDWQLRLAAFARERAEMPFAWGSNDCWMFAADCVLALTGADVAKRLRGSYSTALQAQRKLRARGGVLGVAERALGPSMPPLMARVGDVVLVDLGGQEAIGICNGTSLLGPGPAGTVAMGMDAARACWRIG